MVKIGDRFDLNQSTLLYCVCAGRLLPGAGELRVTVLDLWLRLIILGMGSCAAKCCATPFGTLWVNYLMSCFE